MHEHEIEPVNDNNMEQQAGDNDEARGGMDLQHVMEFMTEQNRQMLRQINEKIENKIESINGKIENANENLRKQNENLNQTINEKIENKIESINEKKEHSNETISRKVDRLNEAVKQQIAETNERLDRTNEALLQFREDIITQINNVEDNNRIRIEVVQQETQEKVAKLQESISEQIEHLDNNIGQIRSQVNRNNERIDDIQGRELINIGEELEILHNQPMCYTQNTIPDSRDTINFRDYKRNPIEFLERVNEWLNRTKENRWSIIKNILDDYSKISLIIGGPHPKRDQQL